VVYLYGAGNLHHSSVQEAAQIGFLTCQTPNIDQNANVTSELFQQATRA
jgi:hypothetical protein